MKMTFFRFPDCWCGRVTEFRAVGQNSPWRQLRGIFFFKTAGTQLLPLSSCCYLKRRCDDDLLGPFKWKRSIECSYIWIAFPLLSKLSWAYLWKCISGFSILFHWSMYLSLQIPCCINYCIKIVSFKVKESDFPPLHSSFSRFKISLRNRFYLITWNAHTYTHK